MTGVRVDKSYLVTRNARILYLRDNGVDCAQIAERFGLSRREVYDIVVAERKRKEREKTDA